MRIPGKFVWHELATPDVEAAKAFYGGLFGWTFQEIHGHHLIYRDGKDIAGIWAIDADHQGKVTPHWSSYVSVEDVDAVALKAVEAGGKVVAGPYDIPGVGRMAVLEDPALATVVAYANAGSDPADGQAGPGEFMWDALVASDVEAARAFYEAVFGWTSKPAGQMPHHHVFSRPDGVQVASVGPLAAPGVPSHWATYVVVPDLAAARAKVAELGGQVVRDEVPLPGLGTYAVIQDPTRAHLRVFQAG
jgi:predicted enzyme related to lactoylglutathione lyase